MDDWRERIRRSLIILLAALTTAGWARAARSFAVVHVDIPAGPLANSLATLQRQAGVQIGCNVPLDQAQFKAPRV